MRMIRTGVHLELAVHRLAELGLRQHPANRLLDETLRMALPDEARALLAQSALVAGVLSVDFLIFLAARELHLRGVDHDNVIAAVEERGIGCLVLALEQAR